MRPRPPPPEAFTNPPRPSPRQSTGFLRPSLTPTLPALFISLTIFTLLLTLLLFLNLRPRPRRGHHRRSLHEMSSQRRSVYDFTGFNVAAGPGLSPRSSAYVPYLVLGVAEDANQPLLQRYRDDPDEAGLELYEATGQRRDGKDGRPDRMHWHGANMLNTAWGWMA